MTRYAVVSPEGRQPWARPGAANGYEPHAIVAEGTLDEVLEAFEERQWSDGLPVVPPTLAALRRWLRETRREPREVLGTPLPELREATVWNAAVNGLMAGCRPHDLPILLAIVEALCDPRYRIEDAGSTTGWEPLAVLSGAGLHERGFNTGAGVMRAGRRANTAIGRFVRLFLRNVAGLRIPPGGTDMCAIGQTFHLVLAEDAERTRELGWPLAAEELGHDAGDLVLALHGVLGASLPIYSAGSTAEPHVRAIAAAIAGTSAHIGGLGLAHGCWSPVLALSPAVAGVLARDGIGKDELRAELSGRVTAPADQVREGIEAVLGQAFELPARALAGDDVLLLPDASELTIVVCGEAGRNQSRFYAPVGRPGRRTVRPVEPPV
jgi:hypothetical protein